MKVLLVILSLVFSTAAYSQEATEILRQIHQQYTQRFDASGRFINDANLTAKFSANQIAAIQKLRANGNLQKSISINNDVMANLVITVSIVQEKNGQLAGLLVERSQYDNKAEEAFLRLYNIPILLGGMDVFTLNGSSLVNLKSAQLTADQGGVISIKYPTNLKSNSFDQVTFNVLKSTTGEFNFFTAQRTWFSQVMLTIWVNIFSQNFGVEKVTFK
ncbi:hypothetical protein K2P97_01480 [bacterium]|nr:hypothetical protein [bacterium]